MRRLAEENAPYAPVQRYVDPKTTPIEDGVVVSASSNLSERGGSEEDYGLAFRNWLVRNTDEGAGYDTFSWYFPKASSSAVALAHVEQFVADSPDWPQP